jgi:integrase
MAKRLTEKAVERLRIKRDAYVKWDTVATGLGVKVTPAGAKIWLLQLIYPGYAVQSRRTLGKYPALGLGAARAKAAKWYGLVKQGLDPADAEEAEREQQEAERRAAALKRENTFASVAEAYIAERANNRRAKTDAQEIRRMLVAAWGDRPIHKIEPRDVRQLIDKIKLAAPYDARNAWTHASGIFKQAVHIEIISSSPCASLDRRLLFRNVKIAPRQRVLSDPEVAALWGASKELRYPFGPFFRLLLLTATRFNELAKARWSEFHPEVRRLLREAARTGQPVDWAQVDNSVKLWTVPAERFKSGVEHTVPLSDDALTVLENVPRFGSCDFVFTANGLSPISDASKAKIRLDKFMLEVLREAARKRGDDPKETKLPDWVSHDLRRGVRSNLSALDVPDHVAEMCLGHGRRGLQRVYDQHRYLDEQREALERWAAKIRTIVEPAPTAPPENVLAMPVKRRARR